MILNEKPIEISPWLPLEQDILSNHKALCSYCALPLEVISFKEVRYAEYKGDRIKNYDYRYFFGVWCRKGRFRRAQPPSDIQYVQDFSAENLSVAETVTVDIIESCGKIHLKLVFENIIMRDRIVYNLYNKPTLFSDRIQDSVNKLISTDDYDIEPY